MFEIDFNIFILCVKCKAETHYLKIYFVHYFGSHWRYMFGAVLLVWAARFVNKCHCNEMLSSPRRTYPIQQPTNNNSTKKLIFFNQVTHLVPSNFAFLCCELKLQNVVSWMSPILLFWMISRSSQELLMLFGTRICSTPSCSLSLLILHIIT